MYRFYFQGLLQILETNVTVRCREVDVQLVRECLDSSARSYQDITKKSVRLAIDQENYLHPDR